MPRTPPLPALFAVTALAWGATPWLPDHGLLVFVALLGWAGLVRESGIWAAGALLAGSAGQLAWLPQTWSDAQGDGGLLVFGAAVVAQSIPAVLASLLVARSPKPWTAAAAWAALEVFTVQPLPALFATLVAEDPVWVWPAAFGGRPLLSGALAGGALATLQAPRRAVALVGVAAIGWTTAHAPDHGRPLAVGVVQPDVHVLDARVTGNHDALAGHLRDLLRSTNGELLVTPEGAWPMGVALPDVDRPVVLGATLDRRPPRRNALVGLAPGQPPTSLSKTVLVPLWERSWWGFGDDLYRPGDGPPLLELDGVRLGGLICYEDLFEGRLRATSGADLLVAATNDSWLGRAGREVHHSAARLAAVTTGTWVVRPTLDGRSAVFDRFGHTRAELHDMDARWPDTPGRSLTISVRQGAGWHPGAWLGPLWALGFTVMAWRRR